MIMPRLAYCTDAHDCRCGFCKLDHECDYGDCRRPWVEIIPGYGRVCAYHNDYDHVPAHLRVNRT